MTRLFLTELRRFAARRSFRLFGLLALAGIVIAATITFIRSDPTDQAAQVRYQEAIEACIDSFAGPDLLPTGYDNAREFCSEQVTITQFSRTFRLTALEDVFTGTSAPLIILGLAFGASFIGAEWQHGTITTFLTWEPRRVRVMAGKIIAVAVATLLSAAAIQALLGLALWPVAAIKGSTAGVNADWFFDTSAIALRGAVIAGLAAAVGFAMSSMARNSTAAVLVGFLYLVAAEPAMRGLRPAWQRWLISDNAAAFVTADPASIFGRPHSVLSTLLVVAGYALGLSAMATALFKSRDVT